MSPHRKAVTLALAGFVILVATKPIAQATVGLPILLWNAIYLIGFVVGISCMVIGGYRALLDRRDTPVTSTAHDSIKAPNAAESATGRSGRNTAFVLNACVLLSDLASLYLSSGPPLGSLALAMMFVCPVLNIINILIARGWLNWMSLALNVPMSLIYLILSIEYVYVGMLTAAHAKNFIDSAWAVLMTAAILASVRYSVLRLRSRTRASDGELAS